MGERDDVHGTGARRRESGRSVATWPTVRRPAGHGSVVARDPVGDRDPKPVFGRSTTSRGRGSRRIGKESLAHARFSAMRRGERL